MAAIIPMVYEEQKCSCACHRYPEGTILHCVPCCYPWKVNPLVKAREKSEMVIISVDSDEVIPVGETNGSKSCP
jgi:hypothetical protein